MVLYNFGNYFARPSGGTHFPKLHPKPISDHNIKFPRPEKQCKILWTHKKARNIPVREHRSKVTDYEVAVEKRCTTSGASGKERDKPCELSDEALQLLQVQADKDGAAKSATSNNLRVRVQEYLDGCPSHVIGKRRPFLRPYTG